MAGAIAAGDAQTAEAGAQILREGGNAIDAAVAASMAAFLTEPLLCSAGGAGIMVACKNAQPPLAINFFATMPSLEQTLEESDFDVVKVDFGATTQAFHVGRASAAVPLALPGLAEAVRCLGTMSLTELVGPAIRLAREGVVLDKVDESIFELLWPIIVRDRETVRFYGSDGEPPAAGSRLRNPQLADTLEAFAQQGDLPSQFLEGIIEEFGPGRRGHLTHQDLSHARVEVQSPHHMPFGNRDLYTSPMLGGLVMADVVRRMGESAPNLVRFAEAARAAHAFRSGYAPRGSTTHISVIDAEGNAASVTLTNGEGCGHLVKEAGVQMNNFLGEEDLNPDGFFLHKAGSRLPTMIAPTLVFEEGRPVLAAGSGGANRIRSAVSRVVLLERHMGLRAAVHAPRIHAEERKVWYESVDLKDESALSRGLAQSFDDVAVFPQRDFYFGGVHAVGIDAAGEPVAVGDPRRAGVGITV